MTGLLDVKELPKSQCSIETELSSSKNLISLQKMNKECPICIEKCKLISCMICNYSACKTCIRKYILQKESEVGSCMNCNTAYTRASLVEMLGITFVKDVFTQHQHKVRINKQNKLLPTFQPIAERQIMVEKLESEMKDLMEQYNKAIVAKRYEINSLRVKKDTEEKKYIRPCSVESCNGFLNTAWKCGICDIITCKDCFIPITNTEEEHVCEAGAKETATLIKKDTKCCPKCGNGIYKTEGCDQMYCTICHTAFSWRTGQIETGRVHNPHYYQHLRAMAAGGEIRREEGDELPVCDGCQENITERFTSYPYTIISIATLFKDKVKQPSNILKILDGYIDLVRYYYHIDSTRQNMEQKINSIDRELETISIGYLRNKLDKTYYEKTVKTSQKKREVLDERIMIIITLRDVIKSIIVYMFNNNISVLYEASRNIKTHYPLAHTNKDSANIIKTYIDILNDADKSFKDTYIQKQKEISQILNYCIAEDEKIAKVYSISSKLDINYKTYYKFLIKGLE